MAPPAVIERPQFGWPRGVEKLEGIVEDGELLGHIERLTQRMAERPAQTEGAWRAHLFAYFTQK